MLSCSHSAILSYNKGQATSFLIFKLICHKQLQYPDMIEQRVTQSC